MQRKTRSRLSFSAKTFIIGEIIQAKVHPSPKWSRLTRSLTHFTPPRSSLHTSSSPLEPFFFELVSHPGWSHPHVLKTVPLSFTEQLSLQLFTGWRRRVWTNLLRVEWILLFSNRARGKIRGGEEMRCFNKFFLPLFFFHSSFQRVPTPTFSNALKRVVKKTTLVAGPVLFFKKEERKSLEEERFDGQRLFLCCFRIFENHLDHCSSCRSLNSKSIQNPN